MNFIPVGAVEVEPIKADGSIIKDDSPKFVECARVTAIPEFMKKIRPSFRPVNVGDIVFFRPHGFFDLPTYEGKKRYVVKWNEEIILGVLKNVGTK